MPSLPKSNRKHKPWGNNTHRKIYDSAKWKSLREVMLDSIPLCEECSKKGIKREATIVDHIIRIKDGGPIWDTDNLQCLCRKCHNSKTAHESNKSN